MITLKEMSEEQIKREQRLGELALQIRRDEKEVYLDFNNPLHEEYFCLQMGGQENLEKEFPEIYAQYMQTKILQKENPNIVTIGEKDVFKDAAQIIYAYQNEEHILNFKGITALRNTVKHICNRLHIYHEINHDLIVATGHVTPNSHFAKLEFEWKNDEQYYTGKIFYDYYAMWYCEESNSLRSVLYSSQEVITGEEVKCVTEINLQNPSHKVTTAEEEIVICYNRKPTTGEKIDYDYSEAFDPKSHKQRLILEVDGEVKLDNVFKEFQWIDITKFVLKLYCESGVANYSLENRVEEVRKAFQKSEQGFVFHLDKDWKGVVPAARLPIVEDVDFLMRFPFTTDKGNGSILISSNLEPEKESNSKKRVSKLHLLWGCVAKDTQIRMADGYTKAICDLKPGDFVMTREGNAVRIMDILCGYEDKLWRIETRDGAILNCTKDHPILTSDGMKMAEKLCGIDKLLREDGGFTEIVAMYQIAGDEVYSLYLEKDEKQDGNTIITNGLLTGDFGVQNHVLQEQAVKAEKQQEITNETRKLMGLFGGE